MVINALSASDLTRNEQTQILKHERTNRKIGRWGAWELIEFPKGSIGRGWAADFGLAHKNKVFSVLDRTLATGVRHLAITSLSGNRPSWPEMQRIKDELAGPEATAVEVYPPKEEIVDGANMYHLWIVTAPLPFTLYGRNRSTP
ncbi:hypothetical protein [Pseudovibrio sp. Tun.PSC04-5.I4]|uniref:DUF7694 domain-containing protein n=1 Tax=Pseudovibrio sp. Tun.PSC04-5.I4 TaxID=1798213 RepID=UPI00088CF5AA|nr:hypothetical protein [Pseudovibrio sp. Tun.PSC04-5.I4]SDR11222.1 hypothetical protein SAMN04515695_2828 [Pseudovibrio sp. Tun.PSC04-5.I4]